MDVHPSKDGVPIVMHDPNTLRTTGLDADISSLTLDKIKELDAGSWFGAEYQGTGVPTLEEVLQNCSGKLDLIIEVKNHSDQPGFEETVARLIESYDYIDHCVVQSPSYESLVKIKQYNENIRCGLVMPVAVGGYYDLPYLDFFSVEHTFVTSPMVEAVHDRGREVFAWTVNDDKFIREMADCGVDCIIGNFPERIYEIIHRNDNEIDSFINSSLLLPDDDRIIVTPEDISDSAAGPDITPDNES